MKKQLLLAVVVLCTICFGATQSFAQQDQRTWVGYHASQADASAWAVSIELCEDEEIGSITYTYDETMPISLRWRVVVVIVCKPPAIAIIKERRLMNNAVQKASKLVEPENT